MDKLIPICLNNSCKGYKKSYLINYGKKVKSMYYISFERDSSICEDYIINKYDLKRENYQQIVEKNHGYHDNTVDGDNEQFNFVFDCKKDCQNAIEDLESYIVMNALTK